MGAAVSRHESNFSSADEVSLDMAELLAALGAQSTIAARDRQRAIACYLSGSEGWRDALDLLGGAFADEGPQDRLKSGQEE